MLSVSTHHREHFATNLANSKCKGRKLVSNTAGHVQIPVTLALRHLLSSRRLHIKHMWRGYLSLVIVPSIFTYEPKGNRTGYNINRLYSAVDRCRPCSQLAGRRKSVGQILRRWRFYQRQGLRLQPCPWCDQRWALPRHCYSCLGPFAHLGSTKITKPCTPAIPSPCLLISEICTGITCHSLRVLDRRDHNLLRHILSRHHRNCRLCLRTTCCCEHVFERLIGMEWRTRGNFISA